MSNNINLWFAKDENKNIITVNDVDKEYKGKYYCPLCGSEVIPKALDSNMVSPHFAHINREACSGESIVHYWVKNQLIKVDDIFEITTNEARQYMCKEILTEQSYETPYGLYRPDATVITYKDEKIFVEINYTNKKKVDDYYLKWKYLGSIVIEFNIKNVYDEENNKINITNSFKALYFDGKEFVIDKNCKEYNNLKKSIKNNAKLQNIDNIEWFIDDIYKYNTKKIEIYDLTCSFLGFVSKSYENKEIIEAMYKIKKCQSSIEDVIKFIFKDIEDFIYVNFRDANIDIEITKNDISKNRFIYHRIFGQESFNIKLSKKSIEKFNKCKKYIRNNFKYEDYKNIMTQNSFDSITNKFKFCAMESTNVRFSIEDICKGTLEEFKHKTLDNAMSDIGLFETRANKIIADAKENLEKIISEKYIDSNILSNRLTNELDLEDYHLLQKAYLPEEEQLKPSKIILSEFYNTKGVKINGVLFYKMEDVESEFRRIKSIIEKHRDKYESQLNDCEELSVVFDRVRCTDESIIFYDGYYYDNNKFIIKNNKLMTSGIVIARIKEAKEAIEIIRSLRSEDSAPDNNTWNVYKKVESRYSEIDGNYYVETSVVGISLYKADRYGNKICLISYHKYEKGNRFDDVINTFSYDLRRYLYGGVN